MKNMTKLTWKKINGIRIPRKKTKRSNKKIDISQIGWDVGHGMDSSFVATCKCSFLVFVCFCGTRHALFASALLRLLSRPLTLTLFFCLSFLVPTCEVWSEGKCVEWSKVISVSRCMCIWWVSVSHKRWSDCRLYLSKCDFCTVNSNILKDFANVHYVIPK